MRVFWLTLLVCSSLPVFGKLDSRGLPGLNVKKPAITEKKVHYIRPDRKYQAPEGHFAPRRHLITWGEFPSREAMINWGVDKYRTYVSHTIYLSKTPRYGRDLNDYPIKVSAQETGLYDKCGDSPFANIRARVKGLQANTTYFYVVKSGSHVSGELHFVTGPASSRQSFKLFSGGDSRSDHDNRIRINKQIGDQFEDDPSYLALVHGGDFINDGSSCSQWRKWIDHHQHTTTSYGRVLPVIATFGNHESGGESLYKRILGDPKGKGRFYFHSRLGAIDLLILNSQTSVEGDQKRWLEGKLRDLDDDERFLLAGYHRPAWPAQKSPGDTTAWIKYFERYDLDLALESDGHTLKQTCPIRDDRCQDGGVIYVGEGGLGVSQRSAERRHAWYFDDGGYAKSAHHVQSIEIRGGSDLQMIYQVFYDGKFQHKITFNPRKR